MISKRILQRCIGDRNGCIGGKLKAEATNQKAQKKDARNLKNRGVVA
jgi:hypothetical protein